MKAATVATQVLRHLGELILPNYFGGPAARRSHGASRWVRPWEHPQLGIVGKAEDAREGVVLGWLGRSVLSSPREDNVLLLGVQRSGKTSTVFVPTLLGWTGAVVATSTKEELVRLTQGRRAQQGPVWVFAPLDRDHAWLERLGLTPATWNPVTSITSTGEAAELADHFTQDGRRGGSVHWYLSASNLLTALIAVAAEWGGDMGTVVSHLNRNTQQHYMALAAATEQAPTADLLVAFGQTPEKEAGSIASTARSCLSLWIDERIQVATGTSDAEVDLDRLLSEGGTLYLVAPAEEAERCRPLFSALLSTLLRKATALARAQGGVLAPRLLLALDEAANFARIPRLAGYASSGPGQGIQLLLGFHDLAQIEAGYGQEEARTIWNNCRARLLLPGQGDLKTLEQFSRSLGNETRSYLGRTQDGQRTSHSEQRTGQPLASVDELRRMHDAVLVYANAPPARLQLRRWDQVPAWRALVDPSAK